MKNLDIKTKLKRLHHRLNGFTIEFDVIRYSGLLNEINIYGEKLKDKSDVALQKMSNDIKIRVKSGINFDDLLIEAYALVRETISRVLNMYPFDVQVIGGIVMHQGKIAEMQTGEGKTLTAVFPAYLNSLTGKGVHILTFNDYLARRDAKWMGPVYEFLGLTVGFVQEGMSIADRQKAYSADITYLTAKEAGFDFLRDSLCYEEQDIVHRNLNFALIDEADSILIDEARIPLVIAGSSDDTVKDLIRINKVVKVLLPGIDFKFDEYGRNIHLTPKGERRAEHLLGCNNIYDLENIDLLTRLYCSIHAEYLLSRDVDYIIRNDKIDLVDEFTGRVADKRRWPDGLQSALEAKENISIQNKGNILNSITIQHYVSFYKRICGMTGTAQSAEREFKHFYNLDIVVIPPNKPCIREDYKDVIFKTKEEKNKNLVEEIVKIHKRGQPVLVGTCSVAESDKLSRTLNRSGVDCKVLNAKNDEHEAEIVHDKFHVVKYLNKGIDETRKKEVKTEPLLKKAKYIMLKKSINLTEKQKVRFMEINQANLLTARAWKMKQNFLEIFEEKTAEEASLLFDRWYENVVKSNIKPMKKAAKTLKRYKTGIINIIKYQITNGKAERFNGFIQKLNNIAHGYRNFDNFRLAILFFNGKLDLFSHKSP